MRKFLTETIFVSVAAGVLAFLAGCQTGNHNSAPSSSAAPSVIAPALTVSTSTESDGVIRIKAGSSASFKDSGGNVWQSETGFDGGDSAERPELAIANTKDQGLYQSEHYSMNSFSCKLANGKYVAKLHFAETYDGITEAGQRVFSFNVQGREFKDFDVWAKAGGPSKAYIETVPVEVTNGEFKIVFTPNIENPEINAIEIIPQS